MGNWVYVNGHNELCECLEDFMRLVRENMGCDATEYLTDMLAEVKEKAEENANCNGECEETYRIQEHYERTIRDAYEELAGATGKGIKDKERIYNTLRILGAEI